MESALFEAVSNRDYKSLANLYATNAQDAVVSYLAMKRRWGTSSARDEEKVDEFLQQLPTHAQIQQQQQQQQSQAMTTDQQTYCTLLRELAIFLSEKEKDISNNSNNSNNNKHLEISSEAERLLRDASTILSATRPPNTFVVTSEQRGPPVFDGSVANATPPTGAGAGTILHLACALDVPLALAFLLAMGADARAAHTAFRRLMIHEAACNGSIQCLTLLLEWGSKLGEKQQQQQHNHHHHHSHHINQHHNSSPWPFLPRRVERSQLRAPMQLYATQPELFARHRRHDNNNKMDFFSLLRLFRKLSTAVEQGSLSEIDAARNIMKHATLEETSQTALARGFQPAFLRGGGISDGHGNTPLHWAAFKNEVDCVALLLRYHADANARAHPSGWTPLHDAAYSNSKDTIALLVNAGAHVDARANSGATPLCFAAQEDAADAAELLLRRGADLATRCAGGPVRDDGTVQQQQQQQHSAAGHSRFSGYTPLHYCAHYNAHKAARVLLRHSTAKAAMEIPDLSDRLAVHVAVARGSSDVLRELLQAGVHIETRLLLLRRAAQTTPPRRPPSPPRAPVSSPLLRSMIPSQPITSSKPWNCLSQRSIDECRELISQAEKHWTPERHGLFTPVDRRAVVELLRVGKRLEIERGIFLDLWPQVLSFCGRGWFEAEGDEFMDDSTDDDDDDDDENNNIMEDEDEGLSLPAL